MTLAKALAGVAAVAAVAMSAPAGAAQYETPAPPDPFTVSIGAGHRFTGAPARIDIRHQSAGQPPSIEIAISAAHPTGRTWAALALAPSNFTQTLGLEARVTDRPLRRGDASVQGRTAMEAEAVFAHAGTLQLSLRSGRLVGEATGTGDLFPARFEGPVAVSCAVPASAMAASRPAPASADEPVALVVDENFESDLCRAYAAWAGGAR